MIKIKNEDGGWWIAWVKRGMGGHGGGLIKSKNMMISLFRENTFTVLAPTNDAFAGYYNIIMRKMSSLYLSYHNYRI